MAVGREVLAYIRGKKGPLGQEVDQAREALVESQSVEGAPPHVATFAEVYSAVYHNRKEQGKLVPSPSRVFRAYSGEGKVHFKWDIRKPKTPNTPAPAAK